MERNVAPANWLYHDRGMVKWMGFFLADHTAYNEKQGVAEQPVEGEEEQSLEKIGAILLNAWQTQSSVSLQLKVLVNGQHNSSVTGIVAGYSAGNVYIETDNELRLVAAESIRHVTWREPEKWGLQ